MRARLETRNRALLRDVEELAQTLRSAPIPKELELYRTRILTACDAFRGTCDRNLADLARGQDLVLEDVLSETQKVSQSVRLLSTRLAGPVLRASSRDRLCLTTIGWLHGKHPVTASLPAAFADGDCGIWPFLHIAPIYFFPSLEQRGLLYQPLYFHEFGHLLYACHRQEMDELVRDLQREIEETLTPPSQRNDRHADVQAIERQIIAVTWYRWTQELFCDAVGLTIGGPCFLRAFSGYLGTMDRGDFYREPDALRYSTHPVKWLRIRVLAERARAGGLADVASEVEDEWMLVARTMGVREDYHGFYDQTFLPLVTRALNDMLIEADPRAVSDSEARGEEWQGDLNGLIALLNQSWNMYRSNQETYATWEAEAMQRLLR